MGWHALGYDSVDVLIGSRIEDAIGRCALIIFGNFLYCEGSKRRVVVVGVTMCFGIVVLAGAISVAVAVTNVVVVDLVVGSRCIAQAASNGCGISVQGHVGGR